MTTQLDKPLLTRWAEFITRPTYLPLGSQSPRQTLQSVVQLFCFNIVVALALAIPISLLSRMVGVKSEVTSIFENNSLPFVLLWGVLLMPFIEELVFRSFLRPSPLGLVAPLFPLLYYNGGMLLLIFHSTFGLRLPDNRWIVRGCLLLMAFLICLIAYKIIKTRYSQVEAEQFYSKKIPYLFCFSSFIFGFLHVFNFAGIEKHFYLAPLLMLPYLIGGLTFGYVRIVYGFWWACFLHTLNNAYAFFPIGLFYAVVGIKPPEKPTVEAAVVTLILLIWLLGSLAIISKTVWKMVQESRGYYKKMKSQT